jgi:alkanesulfonate monooxygenase SsuD/methylene tetrahydromethanopterin reductase-like flavin-dependent oxidoreductase (luciferase family)
MTMDGDDASSHATHLLEETMSAINIGIALPTREVAMMGYNDAAPLLKITRQVEELGYDAIWAGDSFVARHRLEPMSLLAAVAMITERVTIGTAAITAVSREPLSLAHTIVTLDQLSGGRLRLGIGTGAPLPVQSEYDAITMTYRERRERVDEMVTAWRTVWNNEDGDLVGKGRRPAAVAGQQRQAARRHPDRRALRRLDAHPAERRELRAVLEQHPRRGPGRGPRPAGHRPVPVRDGQHQPGR